MVILCFPYLNTHPLPGMSSEGVVTIGNGVEHWPNAVWAVNIDSDVPGRGLPLYRRACAELGQLATRGDLLVAMTEESLPIVARAAAEVGCASAGHSAIRRCMNRLDLRMALEPTGLNPAWVLDRPGLSLGAKTVMKALVSCLNSGVMVLPGGTEAEIREARPLVWGEDEWVQRYELGFGEVRRATLLESYATGGSYEVNGVSGLDVQHVFPPLEQHWGEDSEGATSLRELGGVSKKIVGYERVPRGTLANELAQVARTAVTTLGLQWCGWCVEIKGPPWKVIEVNARVGYEPDEQYGYSEALGVNTHGEVAQRVSGMWNEVVG
jgi:hypothetical protein